MATVYVQKGESIDYTPDADVEAGTIVQLGKILGVTKLDIAAGELGALATVGVFDIPTKEDEDDEGIAVAIGDEVYVNLTTGLVCASTTEGAVKFGYAVTAATTDDSSVNVLLVQGLS